QILGICNGFQILTETGLLPGALLQNISGHFESRWVNITTSQYDFWRTNHLESKLLHLPVANGEGRFVWRTDTDGLVFPAFYYVDDTQNTAIAGDKTAPCIAGITDKSGYIMGMMPHPERCCDPLLGKTDGTKIFNSIINSFIN
ncbi:MAG: phosphoribosylformylglycinamidine synthase subunit PurQ, partial [Bacteroidetes bacterium]|nr:phosphoribosylformylglycinamidine synthase subunit PurQ [Bacteroidota bacterium]